MPGYPTYHKSVTLNKTSDESRVLSSRISAKTVTPEISVIMKLTLAALFVGLIAVVFAEAQTDTDGFHFSRAGLHDPAFTVEEDNSFWNNKAQETLKEQVKRMLNKNVAKNVIMFLGDGLSVPTLAATRIYKWQKDNKKMGEDKGLSFEDFPYVGLSRTYCVDTQVADSACSATAYLGGVKANIGTIGVNAHVLRKDCEASLNETNRVDSIAKWAQEAGKATGIVTNTRVTHASPAGAYAHIADRNWEADFDILADGKDPEKCEDIAMQLVTRSPGKDFNVIMGGGRKNFLPVKSFSPFAEKGVRKDGVNLIDAWVRDKKQRNVPYALVSDRKILKAMKKYPDYLLGLFAKSHLKYHLEHEADKEPTLEEMTEAAINVLKKNEKGYFLFVEGGKIDMAHHENRAHMAFDETVEFAKAISKAVQMTSEEDTLIVITADHAHTMSMSGYPRRSESIFGFGGQGSDKKPYTIVNYANGKGYRIENGERPDLTAEDRENYKYVFPAAAPLATETHGGDDVAVFARGPFAHLFTGSYEQNYLAHAMAFASCIGKGMKACNETSNIF